MAVPLIRQFGSSVATLNTYAKSLIHSSPSNCSVPSCFICWSDDNACGVRITSFKSSICNWFSSTRPATASVDNSHPVSFSTRRCFRPASCQKSARVTFILVRSRVASPVMLRSISTVLSSIDPWPSLRCCTWPICNNDSALSR